MTVDLFFTWLLHVLESVQGIGEISPTQKYLLILDRHISHVTLVVAIRATEAGLDIVILTPYKLCNLWMSPFLDHSRPTFDNTRIIGW